MAAAVPNGYYGNNAPQQPSVADGGGYVPPPQTDQVKGEASDVTERQIIAGVDVSSLPPVQRELFMRLHQPQQFAGGMSANQTQAGMSALANQGTGGMLAGANLGPGGMSAVANQTPAGMLALANQTAGGMTAGANQTQAGMSLVANQGPGGMPAVANQTPAGMWANHGPAASNSVMSVKQEPGEAAIQAGLVGGAVKSEPIESSFGGFNVTGVKSEFGLEGSGEMKGAQGGRSIVDVLHSLVPSQVGDGFDSGWSRGCVIKQNKF